MGVYCGIDWAEGHHDIAVVDDTGTLLAKPRISDDPAGLAVLLQILVDCGDTREGPVPVVVETTRGLLVSLSSPVSVTSVGAHCTYWGHPGTCEVHRAATQVLGEASNRRTPSAAPSA